MKLNLKKTKPNEKIDDHLMSFEIINLSYVMLSKKLARFLSLNQEITLDKFSSLFQDKDLERFTNLINNKPMNDDSIYTLKSKEIIKLIFNQNLQYGYFIPEKEMHELKTQIEQLESTLKSKEAFLFEMSHELKTPLQTMISTIELLKESNLDQSQNALLKNLSLSLEQAINSTNNILSLAKLEHKAYEPRHDVIYIKDLIDDIHHMFRGTLEQKNLYFRVSHYKEATIISDESLLKQVLTNMISNAIKFTDEGGLYIETDITSENILKISIEDTGIGMTDEEVNRIFKPFSQANQNIQKQYGGTGLGLSISKKILNLMNGNIEIESTYGSGTKFTISCPIKLSNEVIINVAQEQYKPRSGLSILVAEDNVLSLKVTKQLLENIELKVEVAKNGIEVLNQFKDFPFDVILMDVSMPKMDGFEATKLLREKDKDIPIIAMTANTYDDHKNECYSVGMTDILYKPFKAKDLYQIISKHTK